MDEEQYAADLRPTSIFGDLGAADDFDDEGLDEEYDDSEVYYSDGIARDTPSEYLRAPETASKPAPVQYVDPKVAAPGNPGSTGAAITLFTIVGGAALGWYYGKIKGAAGGALAGGALRNLYRTQKAVRSTDSNQRLGAVQQGMVGLVGLGAGGYLLWTANRK